MEQPDFYRPIPATLCQGGLFERLPSIHIKDMLCVLKKATFAGKKEGYEAGELLPNAPAPKPRMPLNVPVLCDYTRALLLTYDCEIDKPGAKHLTVALVRPLSVLPVDQQTVIRQNTTFACYYLPAFQVGTDESYVDFRRLSTVSPDIVRSSTRLASLSTTAWEALVFQYIRFLTRYEIDRTLLKRPE